MKKTITTTILVVLVCLVQQSCGGLLAGVVNRQIINTDTTEYVDDEIYAIEFVAKVSGLITEVRIGHLGDVINDVELEAFNIVVTDANNNGSALGEATLVADFASNSARVLIIDPFW